MQDDIKIEKNPDEKRHKIIFVPRSYNLSIKSEIRDGCILVN